MPDSVGAGGRALHPSAIVPPAKPPRVPRADDERAAFEQAMRGAVPLAKRPRPPGPADESVGSVARPDGDAPPRAPAAEDERAAFEQAIRGAVPLRDRDRVAPGLRPRKGARPSEGPRKPAAAIPEPPAAPPLEIEPCGEGFEARASGVSRERLRALRAGDVAPDARLDLHGLRADDAEHRLLATVARAAASGKRCLLVVHGRGLRSGDKGPVLRDLVFDRLGRPPLSHLVLAFTPAPARWGGAGALLVLLRK